MLSNFGVKLNVVTLTHGVIHSVLNHREGDVSITYAAISDRRADGPPILVQRTAHVHPQCQQCPLTARVSKGRHLVCHQRQLLSISDGGSRRCFYWRDIDNM